MTQQEFESLIPHETMVYSKRDDVGYTFIGIDSEGKYKLYGMPYAYEDYLIKDCFEIIPKHKRKVDNQIKRRFHLFNAK